MRDLLRLIESLHKEIGAFAGEAAFSLGVIGAIIGAIWAGSESKNNDDFPFLAVVGGGVGFAVVGAITWLLINFVVSLVVPLVTCVVFVALGVPWLGFLVMVPVCSIVLLAHPGEQGQVFFAALIMTAAAGAAEAITGAVEREDGGAFWRTLLLLFALLGSMALKFG